MQKLIHLIDGKNTEDDKNTFEISIVIVIRCYGMTAVPIHTCNPKPVLST